MKKYWVKITCRPDTGSSGHRQDVYRHIILLLSSIINNSWTIINSSRSVWITSGFGSLYPPNKRGESLIPWSRVFDWVLPGRSSTVSTHSVGSSRLWSRREGSSWGYPGKTVPSSNWKEKRPKEQTVYPYFIDYRHTLWHLMSPKRPRVRVNLEGRWDSSCCGEGCSSSLEISRNPRLVT